MKLEDFAKLKNLVEQISEMVNDECSESCRLVGYVKGITGKGREWANVDTVCDCWLNLSEDFRCACETLARLEKCGKWVEWDGKDLAKSGEWVWTRME